MDQDLFLGGIIFLAGDGQTPLIPSLLPQETHNVVKHHHKLFEKKSILQVQFINEIDNVKPLNLVMTCFK